jgi:hypothetical protein
LNVSNKETSYHVIKPQKLLKKNEKFTEKHSFNSETHFLIITETLEVRKLIVCLKKLKNYSIYDVTVPIKSADWIKRKEN